MPTASPVTLTLEGLGMVPWISPFQPICLRKRWVIAFPYLPRSRSIVLEIACTVQSGMTDTVVSVQHYYFVVSWYNCCMIGLDNIILVVRVSKCDQAGNWAGWRTSCLFTLYYDTVLLYNTLLQHMASAAEADCVGCWMFCSALLCSSLRHRFFWF